MTDPSSVSGLILIDKPEGMTSFSVVSRVKRIIGTRKAGHAGTLDPFATGLLTIAVGKATRVLRYLENDGKTYRAVLALGKITSTGDTEGEVVGGRMPEESELSGLLESDYREVRDAVMSMIGQITQVPSIYSAIKIAGRPAYDYARKGQDVEIPKRQVTIHEITIHKIWQEQGEVLCDMTVSCSKGTYIRSLCEDIGAKLPWGGYCKSLRRLRSGAFSIENAYTLEELEAEKEKGDMAFLLGEDLALSSLPSIEVTEKEAKDLRNGKKLAFSIFKDRMENEEGTASRVLARCGKDPVAVIYAQETPEGILIREERVFA